MARAPIGGADGEPPADLPVPALLDRPLREADLILDHLQARGHAGAACPAGRGRDAT
jgi:hypothetical protein